MGIGKFASRHSTQLFTTSGVPGALTVVNGEPVQVCGITFSTTTANATVFTVTDASDTALFVVNLAASSSFEHSVPWIADAGIKIQSNRADGRVVVFHNSPGN